MSAEYDIISTSQNYRGISYNDLLGEWANWLIGSNPYVNNNGDPVFLASLAPCSQTGYLNQTFIQAGDQRLHITKDQAVFFMAIGSIADSIDNPCADSELARRSYVDNETTASGMPSKDDILIDGRPIEVTDDAQMREHKIISRDFTLNVPLQPNLGACLDVPIVTGGTRLCVTGGLAFLIKFTRAGVHSIRIHCKGVSYQGGQYFADSFHQIEVMDDTTSRSLLTSLRSIRNNKIISALEEKQKNGEITTAELTSLKRGL